VSRDLLIPIARRESDGSLCGPEGAGPEQGPLKCPECGKGVFLRTRSGYRAHFVHKVETNCSASTESLIHIAAKEIISQLGYIWLPEIKAFFPYTSATLESPAAKHAFVECKKEVPLFDTGGTKIQPDVLVTDAKGNNIAIEVTYRHPTGIEKIQVISSLNLPCIELDLSEITPDIPLAHLRNVIGEKHTSYRWIYNRKLARLQRAESAQKEIAEEILRKARLEKAQEERKKIREAAQQEARLRQRMKKEARPLPVTWRDLVSRYWKTPHVDKCPKACRKSRGHTFANAWIDCVECDCYCGIAGPSRSFTAVWCGWWTRNPLPKWITAQGMPPKDHQAL